MLKCDMLLGCCEVKKLGYGKQAGRDAGTERKSES
jgi:hypothetical protein